MTWPARRCRLWLCSCGRRTKLRSVEISSGAPMLATPLAILARDQFLALVKVKPSTLDQRAMTGELALALGCSKPAHKGEYLALDGVAAILASMLNCHAGLTLKAAAAEVRQHW